MTQEKTEDADLFEVRKKAERLVRRLALSDDTSTLSPEDLRRLVHELHVHQAELEIQNEELRRAQIELEASKDRYADLYDYSPVGYFTLDRQGLIIEINLSGAAMVNRERRSLLRTHFMRLVLPDDQPAFLSHFRTVFQSKTRESCEIKLVRNGTDLIHVRLECLSVRASGSDTEVCRCAVSDISALKRVEEEVMRQQERVLSSMQEGVCVCDATGAITFTNRAFDAMFGRDENKVADQGPATFQECLYDSESVTFPRIADELVTRGVWRGELKCRKGTGVPFDTHLRMSVLNLFDSENFIAVWEDVTEIKQAQHALRDSEERFRAVFESASDLIYLKDLSSRYTAVNPAFARLLDRAANTILGLRYEDVFGKEGSPYEKDVDRRVLDGQTIEEECTRMVKGVPRRFLEVRAPLLDGQGAVTGLCGIARDITERRQIQLGSGKEPEMPRAKSMQATLAQALRAAKNDTIILLKGETGSGKDYLARYIHDHSTRAGGPYYCINCGAVPPSLAESELFGHERGSFTGAHARKRGLLELAEGGTLLLNEIGELPMQLQAKLLSFLDSKTITRVGGEREISVNTRLMAATNRDLEMEAEAGRFRKDLFYRLSVMVIEVPPLRERVEDIPLLVEELLSGLAAELQLSRVPTISPSTMESLIDYQWPGNVRELRNVLERALIVGEESALGTLVPFCPPEGERAEMTTDFSGKTLREATDNLTRSMCVDALRQARGNKKLAARLLGISRDSLYRYIKDLVIES